MANSKDPNLDWNLDRFVAADNELQQHNLLAAALNHSKIVVLNNLMREHPGLREPRHSDVILTPMPGVWHMRTPDEITIVCVAEAIPVRPLLRKRPESSHFLCLLSLDQIGDTTLLLSYPLEIPKENLKPPNWDAIEPYAKNLFPGIFRPRPSPSANTLSTSPILPPDMPERLIVYVNPGAASAATVRDLMLALSAAYQATGGSGLKIASHETGCLVSEEVPV